MNSGKQRDAGVIVIGRMVTWEFGTFWHLHEEKMWVMIAIALA